MFNSIMMININRSDHLSATIHIYGIFNIHHKDYLASSKETRLKKNLYVFPIYFNSC